MPGAAGQRFAERLRGGWNRMDTINDVRSLEQQLRQYEDEMTRLRVENDQLRRSSQAFGELAERLSIALKTATRVNRRSVMAADAGRRLRADS
jgi:regulator of replication initiation timing